MNCSLCERHFHAGMGFVEVAEVFEEEHDIEVNRFCSLKCMRKWFE